MAERKPAHPVAATRNDEDRVHLIYVGEGAYVPGTPTADLAVARIEADRLVATGLYEIADASAPVEEGETA